MQLCDGFEAETLDSKTWAPIPHSGTVAVDTSFAYRGAHSLAASSAATSTSAQAEISETKTFPSSDLYMRAFVFLPSTTPATPLRLMTAYQADAPYLGISLYATPTAGGFAPRVYDGISNSTVDTTMPSFATNRWVCLEWEVVQANPGRVRVWVDDTEYPDLALSGDTTTAPPFGVISFGLLVGGSDLPASTIWLDEVIVDDARITCAK